MTLSTFLTVLAVCAAGIGFGLWLMARGAKRDKQRIAEMRERGESLPPFWNTRRIALLAAAAVLVLLGVYVKLS